MDVRNCKVCGRIYKYDGFRICLNCRRLEEETFRKVKEYLYNHPLSTIQVVSEETGVSTQKILSYLREGRLEIAEGNTNLILECERCGVSIRTGKFCDKCQVEMEREFKGAISHSGHTKKEDKKSKGRMYTTDRHK